MSKKSAAEWATEHAHRDFAGKSMDEVRAGLRSLTSGCDPFPSEVLTLREGYGWYLTNGGGVEWENRWHREYDAAYANALLRMMGE